MPPEKVRFFEVISVPKVARVQQELVLVDAGTVKGYRVVYWYLLKDKTRALNPKLDARSAFNIGAWLAAPGVVGYALSCWPERGDVNLLQWISLTTGAERPGEGRRRGQHRRHGGVGEKARGGRPERRGDGWLLSGERLHVASAHRRIPPASTRTTSTATVRRLAVRALHDDGKVVPGRLDAWPGAGCRVGPACD